MVLFSPFTPHSNVRLTSHSNVRFFAPMGCHCYEDDTQVYMSFPLNNSTKSAEFLPTSRTYLFVYKQKKKKKKCNVVCEVNEVCALHGCG